MTVVTMPIITIKIILTQMIIKIISMIIIITIITLTIIMATTRIIIGSGLVPLCKGCEAIHVCSARSAGLATDRTARP